MMFLAVISRYWKVAVGFLAATLPVIAYVLGRKDGKDISSVDKLETDLKNEQAKSKFHKEMGEAVNEAERNRAADRNELAKRLRDRRF